jgi:hypothetical protein
MATVMEIIQGLSQVAANGYDGAREEDGSRKMMGLKRDEEVPLTDKRVIDGFKMRLHHGNKLCVMYTTEVLLNEIAEKGKYEDSLLQDVADVVSFIKKEFRKVTGSSLSLTELKDKKPEFDFMQTSLVRTEVKVTCHYEVGGLQDPSEEKDAFREKALKGMEKWLSLASDKRPQNDTRKPEKKDK